jgi:purine nucleosidase
VPTHTSPRNFLIDTDTASDDAVALIMALRAPDVVVRAITVVAGNVGLEQACRNALLVTELCNADQVPVFAGCAKPLLRPAADATWFHGRDGLGDQGFAPRRRFAPAAEHAVAAIARITAEHPGLTLVTLGPLTNVAAAIVGDPRIAQRVARCVVMGGNPCCVGNVTPAAEYNIWCDPEAAEIVLRSGMPVELVGWQLSRGEAALNPADIAAARAMGTPLAHFAIDCNGTAASAYLAQTGEAGIALPDPVAMAVALHPAVATHVSSHAVMVECHSELTRGQTVVDQLNVAGDPRNAPAWAPTLRAGESTQVVWSIDVGAFKRLLLRSLGV